MIFPILLLVESRIFDLKNTNFGIKVVVDLRMCKICSTFAHNL